MQYIFRLFLFGSNYPSDPDHWISDPRSSCSCHVQAAQEGRQDHRSTDENYYRGECYKCETLVL
jgi:hypothetical protein